MFKQFIPDLRPRNWHFDNFDSPIFIADIEYDQYDDYLGLDESAEPDYETAESQTKNLISHLILVARFPNAYSRSHWISEIKNFVRLLRKAVCVNERNRLGSTNVRSDITENLDAIYDKAMLKVLEEVVSSGDGIPMKFRAESKKMLDIITTSFVSSERAVLDKLKFHLRLPKKSPWTLEDFLYFKLPEDYKEKEIRQFAIDSRGRGRGRSKFVEIPYKDMQKIEIQAERNFKESLDEDLLGKLPK